MKNVPDFTTGACSRRIALFTVALLLILAAAAHPHEMIFDFDHLWRYNQTGSDPGPEWMKPSYNDSAWPEGRGIFGFPATEPLPLESPVQTTLSLSNGTYFTLTFYFRTHFSLSGTTSNLFLILTNLIDDGAVFYLNGKEIKRIAMPAGSVTNATLATRMYDVSWTGLETVRFRATNAVVGDNVLAVEVHQWAAGSSDVVFGAQLSSEYLTAPEILSGPEDQTIRCLARPVTFSITTRGEELSYFWFNNGSPIAGDTPVLVLSDPSPTADGSTFQVVVSNAVGVASSRQATLNLLPDECGPRVVSALAEFGYANWVLVLMDENLSASATNTSYYQLTSSVGGPAINVTNVFWGGNRTLQVRADQNLYRTNQYFLTINGLTDVRSNAIAPNTRVPVAFKQEMELLTTNTPWTWHDSVPGCRPIPPDWNQPGFVEDAAWQGPASGDFSTGARLTIGCPAFYFRTVLELPSDLPPTANLVVQGAINAGAVFYLNGTEIGRYNMPAGPITPWTVASNPSGGRFVLGVNGLKLARGLNTLAVEVHSDDNLAGDAAFSCTAILRYSGGPPVIQPRQPLLSWSPTDHGIRLSWPEEIGGFLLEQANTVDGLWREVQPYMSNPYDAEIDAAERVYRLRWEPYP